MTFLVGDIFKVIEDDGGRVTLARVRAVVTSGAPVRSRTKTLSRLTGEDQKLMQNRIMDQVKNDTITARVATDRIKKAFPLANYRYKQVLSAMHDVLYKKENRLEVITLNGKAKPFYFRRAKPR